MYLFTFLCFFSAFVCLLFRISPTHQFVGAMHSQFNLIVTGIDAIAQQTTVINDAASENNGRPTQVSSVIQPTQSRPPALVLTQPPPNAAMVVKVIAILCVCKGDQYVCINVFCLFYNCRNHQQCRHLNCSHPCSHRNHRNHHNRQKICQPHRIILFPLKPTDGFQFK